MRMRTRIFLAGMIVVVAIDVVSLFYGHNVVSLCLTGMVFLALRIEHLIKIGG